MKEWSRMIYYSNWQIMLEQKSSKLQFCTNNLGGKVVFFRYKVVKIKRVFKLSKVKAGNVENPENAGLTRKKLVTWDVCGFLSSLFNTTSSFLGALY